MECWDDDKSYGSEAVGLGYDLARKAGDRPVYECEVFDNTIWFIGEEDEILAKITKWWDTYRAALPPKPSPLEEAREQVKAAKKRLQSLQKKENK